MSKPTDRPDTGAMEFDGDWRGVFIQGQDALITARGLAILADKIEAAGLEFSLNDMMMGATPDGLRALAATLGSAYHHADGPVQRCKPWSECQKEDQ